MSVRRCVCVFLLYTWVDGQVRDAHRCTVPAPHSIQGRQRQEARHATVLCWHFENMICCCFPESGPRCGPSFCEGGHSPYFVCRVQVRCDMTERVSGSRQMVRRFSLSFTRTHLADLCGAELAITTLQTQLQHGPSRQKDVGLLNGSGASGPGSARGAAALEMARRSIHGDRADDAGLPLGCGPAYGASARCSAGGDVSQCRPKRSGRPLPSRCVTMGGGCVGLHLGRSFGAGRVSTTTGNWEAWKSRGKEWKGGKRRSMTLPSPLLGWSSTVWCTGCSPAGLLTKSQICFR